LIPGTPIVCKAQQFDDLPWIASLKNRTDFCGDASHEVIFQGERSGSFNNIRSDNFKTLDPVFWDRMDTTFFCNLAVFTPNNISILPEGGVSLKIQRKSIQDRAYTAADLTTKDSPDKKFKFGRFETFFKPVKVDGVISSFFLYRYNPWQEIDAEFLGNDTSKLLVNVFFNPGQEGNLYNYGLRGTPVLIDLGFDASLDFHRYALEWEDSEIRWFVDDKLVHVRKANYPTPIPNLPMSFHVNTWPICSEELAGKFSPNDQLISTELKSVKIYGWIPPPQNKLLNFLSNFMWENESADPRRLNLWLKQQ
jgi:beta-glucanase (GH16 family)